MAIRVIDINKQERDWQYVLDTYGNVQIDAPIGNAFRVVGLVEVEGSMAFQLSVQNSVGGAVAGQRVSYGHGTTGDIELTNSAGVAEHSAGAGEGYNPRTHQGPVTWQVLDAASEAIHGIGWLYETNHRHLNVLMKWDDQGGNGNGNGDGCDLGPVNEKLDQILAILRAGLHA